MLTADEWLSGLYQIFSIQQEPDLGKFVSNSAGARAGFVIWKEITAEH